jgi:hypothetical protein
MADIPKPLIRRFPDKCFCQSTGECNRCFGLLYLLNQRFITALAKLVLHFHLPAQAKILDPMLSLLGDKQRLEAYFQ